MSQQGYTPYQHYVPPVQPQYAEQQIRNDERQQQYPSYNGYSPPVVSQHTTGASYGTVSSLGTGSSQTALNHQVSGYGSAAATGYKGHGGLAPHGAFIPAPRDALHDVANRHSQLPRHDEVPVFEMSAESAQPSQNEEGRRRMGATGEQAPVQANPWPFYLDVSPTQSKKDHDNTSSDEAHAREKKQEDAQPVQAFPWPYHGPSTEDEGPQATVHPPLKKNTEGDDSKQNISASQETDKNKPLPPVKDSTLNKPLHPAGKDESVLDDILADMDAQDEQSGCEGTEDVERPAKDPSLRPPPLNLVRPQSGGDGRPRAGSGAISSGGRTYIPYRPGASPTTSPTTQSPPQHQPQQFNMVTAPHHVYLPQAQSALSPPPQPMASTSPFSTSPASTGSFAPYRPPSPNAPLSASSTGLGLQSPSHGSLGSPKIAGDAPAFVAYQPSTSPRPGMPPAQTDSGLASPNQIASPTFPPPQHFSSPRPSASPRPDTSPRPSQGGLGPSSGFEGSGVSSPIAPYPPSPPRVSSPYAYVRPGHDSGHSNPGSPAPLAFYPPSTTQQQAAQPQDPISGRLASPSVGATLSRPSSRNDSASVHSGVSSAMGGAPVNPQSRPSPTSSSAGAGSQPPQYFSPHSGTQQYQHPPHSPLASSPYNVPQQTYVPPTVSSPQSETSPYLPPQAARPHATTLPSPIPSPLSPPPPYTAVDLPPRPGSQPAAARPYQETNDYHPSRPQQSPSFPPQPTYAPNQGHHQQSPQHQPQPQFSPPPPPNLNQSLPPLPPRPSTSHNGRPPPPPPRPQGFGSALPSATNFPPPPRPNYNGNGDRPPPMPPRPPHHQNSYGSTHYASGQHSNKIFGSQSAKKWLDKTERLVEQTIGDILQPQVDQSQRPPGGAPGSHYHGNPPHGVYAPGPPQPQYAPPPPSSHQRQHPQQHRPPPQNGPYPDMGRERGRRS